MRITLLGSSSAFSTAERDNTFMVVEIQGDILLIDCAGSPVKKLLQLGLDYALMDNILVTHWHEDHTYGLASLLHEMLLKGRKRRLTIFLPYTSLRVVKRFLQAFFDEEDEMYEIEYHPLEMTENATVLTGQGYEVSSTPVIHGDGTLAYKVIEQKRTILGSKTAVFVYSSDTKPCEALLRFAQGADLLVHECTFLDGEEEALYSTHTTALQAGEIAAETGVKKLVLVHFGVEAQKRPKDVLSQVKENYSGEVVIGEDLLAFEI